MAFLKRQNYYEKYIYHSDEWFDNGGGYANVGTETVG